MGLSGGLPHKTSIDLSGSFFRSLRTCLPLLLLLAPPAPAAPRVDRVIIIKADGLPGDFLQRFSDPSTLPWIREIFERNGARLDHFYVRGLSLSAPSWSLLDTGRHLEIRGNVEFDRYTLRPRDYLNFFPFYLAYARSRRVDMTGVELLDELGVPLLIDRFDYPQRFQGPQLLQRGLLWTHLPSTLKRAFIDKPPKQVFDEWQTGLSWSESWERETQRQLLERLRDPAVRYLDCFATAYDHHAHLTPDRVSQLRAVQSIDELAARIWSAVASSPYPDTTALILVSDHGMNTSEGIYSQGYNLVNWFASAAGGGHHVLTNRHPLTEYKLKGLDPFVSEVITPGGAPPHLAGKSSLYPTVILDLDGNERASVALRSNTFNLLHILYDQLAGKRLEARPRAAAIRAFFGILDDARPAWRRDLESLEAELAALDARMTALAAETAAQPRKWTPRQKTLGLDKDARRAKARLEEWKAERSAYAGYLAILRRLLSLERDTFDPGRFRVEALIPPKSLGPPNSIADLQRYAVGLAPGGLALAADGSLDFDRSFRYVDYFQELSRLRVRNNVQREIPPRPVDFIATRIAAPEIAGALPAQDRPEGGVVWLWRGVEKQALVLARRRDGGALELRCLPVARLVQDASSGPVRFHPAEWSAGLPLELFEDPALALPPGQDRAEWLEQWHTEREWLEATHRTRYSNGIVGIVEQLLDLERAPVPGAELRLRQLRRADLLVFAAGHWNFNVRGFNPGGNHGSLLRPSTHSVWMLAGGLQTGLPRGLRIEAPYDSLSFAPTVLALLGREEPDLPGPLVRELFPPLQ